MFLHVTKVKYIRDYRLWLRFDNDKEGFINLEKHLWGEVFEPLKDKGYFSQVYLNPDTGTIEWPNEADFAPEFLLENLGLDLRLGQHLQGEKHTLKVATRPLLRGM